ncbi:hypothetical protein MUO98_00230 [Candidatus Bathyarchaeota archaeon]|nr:hypothetical protein [Candidatus Bathyarchaeota archaeon]
MKKLVLLVAVAVVLVSVLGVYYLIESSNAPNIEGPSSAYLQKLSSSDETMIFLVSTDNPRYGVYEGSDVDWFGGEVHEGDPCFIVNVTVRNDYTTTPLWTDEDSPSGLYNRYVKLTALLYNQQGEVDAVDVTGPINFDGGVNEFLIEPEQTHSVELTLATDSKNVEQYEIYVAYVGPLPEP